MDVKSVREKLSQVIEMPRDDIKYQAFVNEYSILLEQVKINTDTANIAFEAVKIDQGVNFLDTFAALDKKQIQGAWKIIRGCEEFKNNIDYNALKLICSFLASALSGDFNAALILGNILTAVVDLVRLPMQEEIQSIVYEIIREYVLEVLPKGTKFPEWKNIRITPEKMLLFCITMEEILKIDSVQESDSNIKVIFAMKKWLSDGKRYAEETKVLKEKEKNKPPRKSTELLALVEHFKILEDELDKSIYETAKLTLGVKFLKEELGELQASGRDKDKKIKEFQRQIEELKLKVSQANQELDERKKLNDVQIQYIEDVQVPLLQDIARALKPEYGDYAETKDFPMSEMLGEIYREKLKQIFKILEQKGIKVRD